MRRLVSPRPRLRRSACQRANRIVADANAGALVRRREALGEHRIDRRSRRRREIKFERRTSIEIEAIESACQCLLACRQAEAVVADCAGTDDGEAAGAVIEFAQCDFIREPRIGMIDAR